MTVLLCATGCGQGGGLSSAEIRAQRRAYDGAPPTIPHLPLGGTCVACHSETGLELADFGFAPPSPHSGTSGLSERSRCQQCHVYHWTDTVFVASSFVGLPQDLRSGRRLNPISPPVIPHQLLMRENCQACHTGPAAREQIRTTHPQRVRCRQCHLSTASAGRFAR